MFYEDNETFELVETVLMYCLHIIVALRDKPSKAISLKYSVAEGVFTKTLDTGNYEQIFH